MCKAAYLGYILSDELHFSQDVISIFNKLQKIIEPTGLTTEIYLTLLANLAISFYKQPLLVLLLTRTNTSHAVT